MWEKFINIVQWIFTVIGILYVVCVFLIFLLPIYSNWKDEKENNSNKGF